MLKKQYRLKSSIQIKKLRQSGQLWRNHWLVLIKSMNQDRESRFAFAVSRKIGGAVTRNRVKRLIREATRRRLAYIERGWDVLFIARTPAREARFEQIDRGVRDLLQRAHLQIESPTSTPTPDESTNPPRFSQLVFEQGKGPDTSAR